jgi:hypothetical protein
MSSSRVLTKASYFIEPKESVIKPLKFVLSNDRNDAFVIIRHNVGEAPKTDLDSVNKHLSEINGYQVLVIIHDSIEDNDALLKNRRLLIMKTYNEQRFFDFIYSHMDINEIGERVIETQKKLRAKRCFTVEKYLSDMGAMRGDLMNTQVAPFTKDLIVYNSDVRTETITDKVCSHVFQSKENKEQSGLLNRLANNLYMYHIVVFDVDSYKNDEWPDKFEDVAAVCKSVKNKIVVCVPCFTQYNISPEIAIKEGLDLLNYEIRDRPAGNIEFNTDTFTKDTNTLITANEINIQKYLNTQ